MTHERDARATSNSPVTDPSSRTIGLLGGSFDPPHMGHVLLAVTGLVAHGLAEVWLVPCRSHPFGKVLAPFEERVAMCRLAVAPLGERVKVSTIEGEIGDPGEPNYTVTTLEALHSRHPAIALRLLIGSDLVGQMSQWRAIERVRALAPPLVLPRMAAPAQGAAEGPQTLPAISATAIRERLSAGESIDGWVPRAVAEHIAREGLYGTSGFRVDTPRLAS